MAEHSEAQTVAIDWIEHILERKRWTGTDLARKASLSPSTILRLINGKEHRFIPSLRTLQAISNASGYPIPAKVTSTLGAPSAEGHPVEESVQQTSPSPQRDTSFSSMPPRRSHQVKVQYVSSLPASMHPPHSGDVMVACPPSLESDETAFAFYLPGSDLEPWFKAGTMMFATRRRDPYPADLILVMDKAGKSKVRILSDINETGLVLSKDATRSTEKMKFDDIKEIAVVAVIDKMSS